MPCLRTLVVPPPASGSRRRHHRVWVSASRCLFISITPAPPQSLFFTCFLPHLSHATHTRPPHHSLLPHTTDSTVNQDEGPHSRAGGGPLQVSSRAGAITKAQPLTPQQRLGQRRNNWRCHWNNGWRCRSLRCKQKISFIQSPYAAFPCFPCHLDRNICWYVILTASGAVDPSQNSKLIVHVSCHCCRSRLGQIRH
jgi:hypothetical protein